MRRKQYDLPIIGVHRVMGFLNDIAPDEFSALEPILNGYYLEQPRNLLQTQFTTADNNLQRKTHQRCGYLTWRFHSHD